MKIRIVILALALFAAAPAAHAQDGTLDRIQNLIATGRLTEARNTLAQWEREHADPASAARGDDRARALYLSGVLSTDAKAAEDAFIGVILSYPSSPVAPEALLRLGQALYTGGETQRALTYLERLRTDYPGAPARETGMLWLARTQLALGDAASACGITRESLLATTNQNTRTLIELERDKACAQSGGVAVQPAAPVNTLPDLGIAVDPVPGETLPPPEPRQPEATRDVPQIEPPRAEPPPIETRTGPARTEPTRTSESERATPAHTTADAPEFAVQTAAFSQRRAAETIAGELRAKGFDARIVTVPGSPLFRVRMGEFRTKTDAAAAALRVRDAGFATLIVNDVRLEQRL